MAQALTEGSTRSGSGSTGKIMNVVLWVLQIAAAGMFLMAGSSKLWGNEQMVGLFEAIGLGQWFRYLTGTMEVAGAILLLIPRISGLGALILVGLMAGAVMTHLLIVGGSPLMAIILLVVMGVVAWGRRQRTMNLLTWIGGQWLDCGEHRESMNPATGEVIGSYANGGRKEAELAVNAALKAFRETDWKS